MALKRSHPELSLGILFDSPHSGYKLVDSPASSFPEIMHYVAQLENFRLKVFSTVADRLNFREASERPFLT